MTYNICLNPLSLPAANANAAALFLDDIFMGIASLYNKENNVILYSGSLLDDVEFASSYTFRDYKNKLITEMNQDLALFVLELEDKSPFLDKIPDTEIETIMNYRLKIFETPFDRAESDILIYASLQNAILMSLPTNDLWKHEILPVKLENVKTNLIDEVDLLNIFSHKVDHLLVESDWKEQLAGLVFSSIFNDWFDCLHEKNKIHVKNLLTRAYELNFRAGSSEQAKEEKGTTEKIWEWRGGHPLCGKGRIRIFFSSQKSKNYILYGFIKTSNNYSNEIREAENALRGLLK
jgi:hypothetical protein